MDVGLLELARGGDSAAFAELVSPHRRELQLHCYRLLGSTQDAEDAVQETLVAAWQGLAGFEGRSSVRTWLYRVATNRCLDARRAAGRRAPVMSGGGFERPEPNQLTEVFWLEPYPDALLDDVPLEAPGPEAVVEAREATSLAFVAAVQTLPPRQRAVLILRDVLGYRAVEVATMLDATEESVTSALKRARATMGQRASRGAPPPVPGSAAEQQLVARFVDAFSRRDVSAMVELLTEDVLLSMPPMPFEYVGRDAAARFYEQVVFAPGNPVRFVHTRANGQPAIALYAAEPDGVWHSMGVLVLTCAGDQVCEVTRFEPGVLDAFGLPRTLS